MRGAFGLLGWRDFEVSLVGNLSGSWLWGQPKEWLLGTRGDRCSRRQPELTLDYIFFVEIRGRTGDTVWAPWQGFGLWDMRRPPHQRSFQPPFGSWSMLRYLSRTNSCKTKFYEIETLWYLLISESLMTRECPSLAYGPDLLALTQIRN